MELFQPLSYIALIASVSVLLGTWAFSRGLKATNHEDETEKIVKDVFIVAAYYIGTIALIASALFFAVVMFSTLFV